MKKIVYHAMIKAQIEYSLIIIKQMSKTQIIKIDRLHRKIIQTLLKDEISMGDKYVLLNTVSIQDMIDKYIIVETVDINIDDLKFNSSYNTRQKTEGKIKTIIVSNRYGKRNDKVICSEIYKKYPKDKIMEIPVKKRKQMLIDYMHGKILNETK